MIEQPRNMAIQKVAKRRLPTSTNREVIVTMITGGNNMIQRPKSSLSGLPISSHGSLS